MYVYDCLVASAAEQVCCIPTVILIEVEGKDCRPCVVTEDGHLVDESLAG